MSFQKHGEGKVLRDEDQKKTAATKEWTEEDQEELEEELDEDG